MNKPLVSICCITYNHEQFIAQALDGFIMQQTNFDFEIVISDDCSKDSTQSIINSYKIQYPHLFKDISPKKNLGMMKNFKHTLESCTGKYIALCEGDDHWTDPLKLQKQVDFLEENEEYVMCFHKTEVNDLLTIDSNFKFVGWYLNEDRDFTIKDYFNWDFCATTSIVFKSKYLYPLPQDFVEYPVGDYLVCFILFIRSQKKARYLHENMAVYNNHSGGFKKDDTIIDYNLYMISFFEKLFVFAKNYNTEFCIKIITLLKEIIRFYGKKKDWGILFKYFSKYLYYRFLLFFYNKK